MTRHLVPVLALAAIAGCKPAAVKVVDGCAAYDGKTCLSLEVVAPSSSSLTIDQLEIAGISGFEFSPVNDSFSPSEPGAPTALPVVVPIVFPDAFAGSFTLAVRALRSTAVVAHGTVAESIGTSTHRMATVTLSAGVGADADTAQSTVGVDRPTGVAANGVDAAVISVHLVDASGAPLSGRSVALSVSPMDAQLSRAGLTDATGSLTARLTSQGKGTYTVSAVVEPSTAPQTLAATVAVTFVTPGKLEFVVPPTTAKVDTPLAVQVRIVDPASGAVIPEASTPITVSMAGGSPYATLAGDVAATPVNGIASFSNLNVDVAGANFTLTARGEGLTAATSAPFDVVARAWQWTGAGIDGGRINAVAIDPVDSKTMYATSSGGVYKSIDGGASWRPANFGLDHGNIAIAEIAIDRKSPTTLFAAGWDTGLYKSTNGGSSWSPVSVALGASINRVAVDAATSTVLIETTSSILRSTDGGATWSTSLDGGSKLGLGAGVAYAFKLVPDGTLMKSTDVGQTWTPVSNVTSTLSGGLTVDPGDPMTVFMAGYRTLSKSIDGGKIWTPLTTGLPADKSPGRITIAQSNSMTLFAAYSDGKVYKSTDDGQSWMPVSLDSDLAPRMVAVDPKDADKLFAPTMNGLLVSSNGGMTWSRAHAGIRATLEGLVQFGGELLALTASGVYQSTNGGKNWLLMPGIPDGLTPTSLSMATTPGALPIITTSAFISDRHDLLRYDAGALKWTPLNPAATGLPTDGVVVAVDPANENHILVGGNGGNLYRTNDGGATAWTSTQPCSSAYTSVARIRFAGSTIYAACATGSASGGNGVLKSTDGGTVWTPVSGGSGGIPTTAALYDLAVSANGMVALAGGANGVLFRTTDFVNWPSIGTGLPMAYVASISIDETKSGHYWVASNGVAYETSNTGGSWQASSDGLQYAMYRMVIDVNAATTLYMAGIGGVYKTTTGGR